MKAVWGTEYDYRTDKCYECPQCPECQAPIAKYEDGEYRCVSCGERAELDATMLEWLKVRSEIKTEYKDCPRIEGEKYSMGCGGKQTVETHYMRNPVTLEWQTMGGTCSKCGMRFLV